MALVSICLIRWYKKKQTKRPRRVGSFPMPGDESFGKGEKYELTDKSEGKIVLYEDVDFWAEGRSNEAFN